MSARVQGARQPGAAGLLSLLPSLLLVAAFTLVTAAQPTRAGAAGEANDEIHTAYGDDPGTSMWVHWRGPATTVDYGTSESYVDAATGSPSPITPVDIAGPFMRARLTGLLPGTVYHYRIGDAGLDHLFETAPTGDFVWDDIGDTGTTYYDPAGADECNKPWMSQVWQQLAADLPDLVTHGGDISYANDCGQPAVHRLFEDIAPIATLRPIQFAWGNHEYGLVDATAPPGTPRDSVANYKGRAYVANPQLVPNDTPTQTGHPGCPPPPGGSGNGCRGYDWGSFQVGHVLFISYPEPEVNAYPDWKTKADALMAAAQADPDVTFVVTYGHRPAYTSLSSQVAPKLKTAIDALGDKYSPAGRPDGKYVLSIAHHVHGAEVFAPQHGVVHMTNGGGGTEQMQATPAAPGSQWKSRHFSHLRIHATTDSLRAEFVCGPVYTPNPNIDPCTTDSVMHETTITRIGSPPGPTEHVSNRSVEGGNMTGWLGAYNAKSRVTDVQPAGGAHDGTWALRVNTTATTAQAAGVQNAKPFWVTNSVAGTTYTGSAWVSGPAGVTVNLMLRECTASGSCSSYRTGSVKLPAGNWAQVATSYTASASGRQIRFVLWAGKISASQAFYADAFSLSSP